MQTLNAKNTHSFIRLRKKWENECLYKYFAHTNQISNVQL